MKDLEDNIEKIIKFFDEISISSPLNNAENRTSYKKAYRYVHTLLIWEEVFRKSRKGMLTNDAIMCFREMLSDISSAQILLLMGLYKASRMLLRSSIENMFRLLSFEQGFSPIEAKFTFELITLVRSSKFGAAGSPVQRDIGSIIESYRDLCCYAHASTADTISLRVPLAEVCAYDKSDFVDITTVLRELCSRYNRLIYAMYHRQLRVVSHGYRDYVLDSLPKSLKKTISE